MKHQADFEYQININVGHQVHINVGHPVYTSFDPAYLHPIIAGGPLGVAQAPGGSAVAMVSGTVP